MAVVWLLAFCGAGGYLLLGGGGQPPSGRTAAGHAAAVTPTAQSAGTPAGVRAVRIEDVRAGDRVWACDPATGQWSARPVLRTMARSYAGDVVAVTVGGERVEATGNHPFWVAAGDGLAGRPAVVEEVSAAEQERVAAAGRGRWVQARHLRAGDVLLRRGGAASAVEAVASRQAAVPVYNFAVGHDRTYAVGRGGVLVHNNETCLTQVTVGGRAPLSPDEQRLYDLAEIKARRCQNSGIEYPLQRPDGVSDADWQSKLDALNNGANAGRAKVVYDPVRDGKAQRDARKKGMIKPNHDADHGLDLQFGGKDDISEIISTESRVNRSVGAQGSHRKKYPDGTPIKKFVEKK